MTTILDYWNNMMFEGMDDDEMDAVFETQDNAYDMYEQDEDEFWQWCEEHNIDVDSEAGHEAMQSWVWDMCGD